jgi:hypothetical protein
MPFARRRRVDLYLLAAAAHRLISVGGGGIRFSAARRRWRGGAASWTPDPISHFLFSIFLNFYQYKSAFYLLFNRQA